jgi:luciferase family oxidoreductase group 1
VPLWILGSSLFGAQLAAMFGLPFAFASHFAPDSLMQALELYRAGFKPSKQLDKPYAMVGCNVIAAETDAEARRIATSLQQAITRILRNARGQLPPPIDDIETFWEPAEKAQALRMLRCTFVGAKDALRESLKRFLVETAADEVIVSAMIYDHAARVRSYEILSQVVAALD